MLRQLTRNMQNTSSLDKKMGRYPRQAAVLIALTENEKDPSVILTKRAAHLSSHSGEVSLPGGKWEHRDNSLLETALRESHEEIGLESQVVEVISSLPVFQTWQGVKVTPYVGVVPESLDLVANPGELDAIFHVPLSFFLEDKRVRTDVFPRASGDVWSPAYEYDGYEIWGFTARLMVNFLNEYYGADLGRMNDAIEKDWSKEREYIERQKQALLNGGQ